MKKLSVNNDNKTGTASPKPDDKSTGKNTANQKDPKNSANSKQNSNQKQIPPNSKNLKNAKGQIIVEEEVKPPPPREKNLERFIYVTSYYEHETMRVLKELFESINKEAFALKSIKEIYTKTLTPEEQDDNNIDYISGFQIIDSNLRITILEGISSKSMQIVKQRLPKLHINNNFIKVFSDTRILFDTRIYSKFNLCLKFIKLRDSLNNILVTFDIYQKANKYKEIYNAFMNLGFILQSQTFQEISQANLFPIAESLLMLERKYADILNDEDMTGIKSQPKIKKKIRTDNIEKSNYIGSLNSNSSIGNTTDINNSSSGLMTSVKVTHSNLKTNINVVDQTLSKVGKDSKTTNKISIVNETSNMGKKSQKLDTQNYEFFKHKEAQLFNHVDHQKKNIEYVQTLNLKANTNKFCKKPIPAITFEYNNTHDGNNDTTLKNSLDNLHLDVGKKDNFKQNGENHNIYLYSNQRKNYYIDYFEDLRLKFLQDKDSYYTYSKDYLTLSYPMIKNSNRSYEEYVENRKKWIDQNNKDFNRYEKPKREFGFFPKIKNEL